LSAIAEINLPRFLRIGAGASAELAPILRQLGLGRPLLVTDPFMVECGYCARQQAALDAAGISWGLFDQCVPDPTSDSVEAALARLREGGHDCVVGLGGGSSLDTAKAVAVLAVGGGSMRDYKVPARIDRGLPVIAIPTTAGTGSEATRFAVITDTSTQEKMLCAGPGLMPLAALVDYELSLSMPGRLTADTGLDSLCHALEAYVSRRANPFADRVALAAMQSIHQHIRTAWAEPGNRAAREAMMLAATWGGIAFSNASVTLIHGMSRPIGALFHVPHGLSNAMLLPSVTAGSLPGAASRYADCARCMGLGAPDDSDAEAAQRLVGGLRRLTADLAVPGPREYGIDEGTWFDSLDLMARQALASGSPGNNPREPTAAEIVALYRDLW